MGFFGMFNFDKPGKGIDKDMPEKRGFFLFFDILLRKFWHVVSLSLFYTLFCVPAFMVYFFLAANLIGIFTPISDPKVITWFSIYASLFLLCFFGAGPGSAGQAYVLRNFSREENAWVWDDFWSQTKENFGKSLVLFILDLVLLTIFFGAAALYLTKGHLFPMPPMVTMVLGFFALFALVIYFMMHFFIFPLMVTFDMKLGEILKTALQLTVMRLPGCVLMLLVSVFAFAVFFAMFYAFIALILLFAALGFSFVAFTYTFYATNVIDDILERQSKK